MELDEEWVRPGDGDGEMMIDETGTKASPPSTIASLPVTPSTSTILLPTRKIPPSLIASFQSTFTPIATSLTTSAIPISSESTAPDLVKSVVSSLSNLETATARASDERKSLLRAIGAGRTILSFVQDDKKTRRPRTGEVADALELLGDVLSELEILDCIADLYELAEKVRELP